MRIPRKALSIDFGSKGIKVIEGKYKKDNIQIRKGFTVEISPDVYMDGNILNTKELAKKLKYELSENKIRTVTAHAIISSSKILMREIVIPKVADEEIKSVVNYQIADYLPVNLEEYIVQYLNQGSIFEEGTERIKILLLAIPKSMVLSHLDLLKNAGLKAEVLDYQGNSMAKLLAFNNIVNQDYPIENLVIASIDMGYNNSKVTITKNGKIEVTRIFDFGSQTLHNNIASFFDYSTEEVEEKLLSIKTLTTAQDEFSDEARLINIVQSSLITFCGKSEAVFKHYSTREVGNVIGVILLQGGLSNIPGIEDLFSNYFDTPTMQLSALDMIHWNEDLSKYANAIGGLIRMDVK